MMNQCMQVTIPKTVKGPSIPCQPNISSLSLYKIFLGVNASNISLQNNIVVAHLPASLHLQFHRPRQWSQNRFPLMAPLTWSHKFWSSQALVWTWWNPKVINQGWQRSHCGSILVSSLSGLSQGLENVSLLANYSLLEMNSLLNFKNTW